MTNNALRDILILHHLPGIGPALFHQAITKFGSASEAINPSNTRLLLKCREQHPDSSREEKDVLKLANEFAEKAMHWLQLPGHELISCLDPAYPALLKNIPDPPPVLYAIGDTSLLDRPQVAIVGSRNTSLSGRKNASRFAAELSDAGLVITSGMAQGVDTCAHKGALQTGAATIAVLGTGVDRVYPAVNRHMYESIREQGLLLSEYPLGAEPRAWHFPMRNRIISGLSIGVLVVEAAIKSGSLITARMALEQGRDVFTIPGSIDNFRSRGCHELIRQGAALVQCAGDVLDEIRQSGLFKGICMSGFEQGSRVNQTGSNPLLPDKRSGLNKLARKVLALMHSDPLGVDELVVLTSQSPAELSAVLLELELAGLICLQDGAYVLSS